MAKNKLRLDQLIQEKEPQYSRRQIQSWIMQGKIKVDDQVIIKPGTQVADDVKLTLDIEQPKFVSRAGFKLEKALDHFEIDVKGLVALDAGISTGGFTDCMLQRGIKKVFGVDVGYGQVHEKVLRDDRLHLSERTNLRKIEPEHIGELVDLVTLDLSFISVLKVMDAVLKVMKPDAKLIVLIKPQFEAEREDIGKGGIVRDEKVHEKVKEKIKEGLESLGFVCHGIIDSPITGTHGNKEFLGYFTRK